MERNLLIKEIGDLFSREYFWRQPTVPAKIYGKNFLASDKVRMVNQIITDCATQLSLWSGKKETNPGMYDVVKGYWENGVGLGTGEASTIIRERKKDVTDNVKEIRHPWSAAFVSFIMRRAYPDFKKSRAHNRYIEWAKENRKTGAHPFQAFRVNEVAVEPGDIICFARNKKDWASYENVKGKLTHGDIVTSVQNGYATTVGGNVNKNVEEKTNQFKLDSNGYLQQVYSTIKRKALPKFIAIIKLLPYYEKGYVVTEDGYDIKPFERSGMKEPIGYEFNQEFNLPDRATNEWKTVNNGFTRVSWEITPKQKAGESSKTYEARKTAFIERIHAVLRAAGKNPIDWFNSFTNISFLGVRINHPIHTELATHLTLIEKELAKKYGSATDAAKTLGISQTISGGRGESATASVSLHTFGLAIDIEIHDNPYLGGNISFAKNKEMMDRLKADIFLISPAPKNPKKMDVLNVIFKRAGVLISGAESTYPTGFTHNTRLDLYDQLKTLNTLTVKYFNLADNPPELTSLLKANSLKEWKGKSADDAILIINKDYDWFRNLVVRYSKVVSIKIRGRKKLKRVPDNLIKEKGFLNLDRRLVDEIGLSWGATFGDIMHFDMRNTGVGREIYANRYSS